MPWSGNWEGERRGPGCYCCKACVLISAGQILFLWSWLTGEVNLYVCTCGCQWTPGTGAEGWVRIWEQVHPLTHTLPNPHPSLSLLLLSCLSPSLPQEAYGESDWRDLGARRECFSPQFICSRRGPAGHSDSPEVPLGWESGRGGGFAFRLTALLQCWAVAVATPVSVTQCSSLHHDFARRTLDPAL